MKFSECFELLMKHEGGYSNDPLDAGGETNFGISKKSYPDLDIKLMTKKTAQGIYRKDYWDKIKGDYLPEALKYMAFDCAVNQGVSFAQKCLAQILPDLKIMTDRGMLDEFKMLRQRRYVLNPQFERFKNGWLARLNEVSEKSIV